jgi:hypothetical protein
LVVSRDVLLVYAGLYIRYMGVTPPVSPFFHNSGQCQSIALRFSKLDEIVVNKL